MKDCDISCYTDINAAFYLEGIMAIKIVNCHIGSPNIREERQLILISSVMPTQEMYNTTFYLYGLFYVDKAVIMNCCIYIDIDMYIGTTTNPYLGLNFKMIKRAIINNRIFIKMSDDKYEEINRAFTVNGMKLVRMGDYYKPELAVSSKLKQE